MIEPSDPIERIERPRPTLALVLGASGYVGGELLRLLSTHPHLQLAAAISHSHSGKAIADVFPHLGAFSQLSFTGSDDLPRLLDRAALTAVFSAAPHGSSAALIDDVLTRAARQGARVKIVDLSADFRYPTAAAYEEVYSHAHGAPQRLVQFRCAVPEHLEETPADNVAHPGCFTTAVLLAAVPALKLGLVEPRLQVSAMTGSTGAGRNPTSTTHHPERRSNVFAYGALAHRHEPEMRVLAARASGVEADIHFVPQAGPFARGIYAVLHGRLARPLSAEDVRGALRDFYSRSPFVEVLAEPPRLLDVVGSNRCHLGAAVDGDAVAIFSALDNLVKGAAGGAIQWMNRLLGYSEIAGLTAPGLGWI